jgi:hypothetical protein
MEAAREKMAARQADLVRALVAKGPIPAGFDQDRVKTLARTLVNKRRQALARAWPALVRILGDPYVERFTTFAQDHPIPASGSPLEDGRQFLRWLESQGPLADAARIEALAFDLHFYATPLGLRRRRGFGVKMARMREAKVLVIALRLPWLGERWLRLPLGFGRTQKTP